MWAPLCFSCEENRSVLASMLQMVPLCEGRMLVNYVTLLVNALTKVSALAGMILKK